MDGRYEARGREVFRKPTKTKTGLKMGFHVCTLSQHIEEGAAVEIADALNMHMDVHPEHH